MIEVRGLCAQRGSFRLADVSFEVPDGSVLVVVGPNGSGKTTLLECIAGLHKVTSGKVLIDGVDVTELPPERRRVGYVPADYALFPNTTVRRNIWLAFKKSRGMSAEELRRLLRVLEIEGLLDRDVEALSSGQKQRVAIARALAAKPRVLLLDEPLSSLDPMTRRLFREGFRELIREIFNEFSIPVVYTTHDLSEAKSVGDSLVVMNRGRVEQRGPVSEVFEAPASAFVAEFLGYNILRGKVVSVEGKCAYVDLGNAVVAAFAQGSGLYEGGSAVVAVRPQDVALLPASGGQTPTTDKRNDALIGVVEAMEVEGSLARVRVRVGTNVVRVEVNRQSLEGLTVRPGSEVVLRLEPPRVRAYPEG